MGDRTAKGQFARGSKKPPGSGRKKGDTSRKTKELLKIMEEHNYNPVSSRLEFRERLLERAEELEGKAGELSKIIVEGDNDRATEQLKTCARLLESATKNRFYADKIDSDLTDYVYPRRKSVEISDSDGEPVNFTVNLIDPHGD